MKNLFIPLLIIGLLLFASFGLVMMNHMDDQGHAVCPFETVGTADCAQVQNPVVFATSHLNALSQFFSATPISGFAGLISFLLLLILASFVVLDKKSDLFGRRLLFLVKSWLREIFAPLSKILLVNWLALHENSPAFIKRRSY